MQCDYYEAGVCRSCTIIELPHVTQVSGKLAQCRELLGHLAAGATWLDPIVGPERGFRTKAKMVAGGTIASPTLGILSPQGTGVDLEECPLYPPQLAQAFTPLKEFIALVGIEPYSVPERRGELKIVIVTLAPSGDLMVRFVLRSTESLARLRKHLPWLAARLPQLTVASANILAEHRAVLEGEREIMLTEAESLTMSINGIDLHLRPRSFFQTNTGVATSLYRQAAEWVEEAAPASVWDLYCGVGGFALHVARPGRAVTGVEVSDAAVASAQRSALALGVQAEFVAADATEWAMAERNGAADGAGPELVIVNPPRRGIGRALAAWLEDSGVQTVIYSSCNAVTLAKDLTAMPSLRVRQVRLLDMFPHTEHYEVVVLLSRS
jgi:23S rRNA (uracil747-C5)-methyltransferase